MLEALRQHHPLSLHSVSPSLAGTVPLCEQSLNVLADMNHRLQPSLVPVHLVWSWWEEIYAPDLLSARRTDGLLAHLMPRIDIPHVAVSAHGAGRWSIDRGLRLP